MEQTTKYLESGKRGLVKIVVFRFYISISYFGFGYYLSGGDMKAATAYIGAAAIVNSFMLWSYDRIWNRIQWGKDAVVNDAVPDTRS